MSMSRRAAAFIAFCLISVFVAAQSQRFPAPLGLDRVLMGTLMTKHEKKKPPQYMLSVDEKAYELRGHEKQLKKFVGRKVRITGNAVGNKVSVNSVEAAPE